MNTLAAFGHELCDWLVGPSHQGLEIRRQSCVPKRWACAESLVMPLRFVYREVWEVSTRGHHALQSPLARTFTLGPTCTDFRTKRLCSLCKFAGLVHSASAVTLCVGSFYPTGLSTELCSTYPKP